MIIYFVGELKLTKRQFLKCCLAGLGCAALEFKPSDLFAYGMGLSLDPASGDISKYTREALFYDVTPQGVKCRKCPNECLLGPDETGRCRNRVSRGGKLYTIAYGNPCAVHIDPIEKKPLSHFLPGVKAFSLAVAGCNLACLNCQNWQISQSSPKETNNYDLPPDKAVKLCLASGSESMAFTYSEPNTFYEYGYDTAKLAKNHGIRTIWKSSGFINEEPLRKLCKQLSAANIDLKSFDNGIYEKLNAGKLAPILRNLKIYKEEGVWLEITNLLIPGWTDDMEMIKRMCEWFVKNGLRDCPLHFSRFMPLYKLNQLPPTPVSTIEKAREIALGAGMRYVYVGNVPGHPGQHTYCPKCKKAIIERVGYGILNNHLKDGKCGFCGEKIAGVWK